MMQITTSIKQKTISGTEPDFHLIALFSSSFFLARSDPWSVGGSTRPFGTVLSLVPAGLIETKDLACSPWWKRTAMMTRA